MWRGIVIALLLLVIGFIPASVLAIHGDEILLRFQGQLYPTEEGIFTKSIASLPGGELNGPVVWTGGEGCAVDSIPPATLPHQIALIQRGTCTFVLKAQNALAQGYEAFVVANHIVGGDAVVVMGGGLSVDIPGVFVGYSTGEIMKNLSPRGPLNVHAASE